MLKITCWAQLYSAQAFYRPAPYAKLAEAASPQVQTLTASVPLLVFSDLDGTLLDHDNYSHLAAAPALARLREIGAPLVLASSKTAAEIAPLRSELGFDQCPAIVENGAGVLPPHNAGQSGASDYARLRTALDTLSPETRSAFRGFGDMTTEDVSKVTGLPQDQADLARRRAFSEPGLWDGDADSEKDFVASLAPLGIAARRGGRFLTLSFGGTKADRMAEITAAYRPTLTVALGDAPNDVEMLETADIGVVVHNPHTQRLPKLRGETAPGTPGPIRRTEKPGPEGWNTAMLSIVSTLSRPHKEP